MRRGGCPGAPQRREWRTETSPGAASAQLADAPGSTIEMRPLIALLTDFGTRDPYVAQVKGVIAMRCDAEVIDLSHEIAPFGVAEGAFFLRGAVGAFRGTRRVIIVAVVDPGVGSPRRLLALHDGNLTILAPDNGIASLASSDGAEIREITNRTLFLASGVETFHGRDRFAPAAAALAGGLRVEELGPVLRRGEIVTLPYAAPVYDERGASGSVVAIDRYGNVVTDVDPARVGGVGAIEVEAGGIRVTKSAASYAEMAGSPEPFLIVGSRATLEISVSGGSAAQLLRVRLLDPVRVSSTEY